jgi:lysophospholipase
MGTSSSLFNAILLQIPSANQSAATVVIEAILQVLNETQEDIAIYPNPFRGVNASANTAADFLNITLVDGGEDLQNIPLWPILQKERNVDFIFAVDSSADIQNWPNGTAIVATYGKFMLNATSDVVFPSVPDQQTYSSHWSGAYRRMVNLGLNSRPTFFGCNASNFSDYSRPPPLVVYFPHTPWTAFTNFSTFQLEYSDAEVQAFMDNGAATAVPPPALAANPSVSRQQYDLANLSCLCRPPTRQGTCRDSNRCSM